MVDLKYFLFQLWEWFVNHGIPLTALLLCAILLPRLGRLAVRIIARRFSKGEEATKTRLALIGALVYVIQAIGFFVIIMLALTNLGVPPVGAALPATVLTAAIGFGSQKIIGDFLAGFFIISERQFGVGDFVSFDGTTSDISGTVVALTLRATKVRTPSGELVTVPNGSAGVITNYSQEWSRAVVNLAIPLHPGEAMDDLISTVETTVHRAVKDPSIVRDVRGQIEILPATEIIAPVAAGQPWAVNFRVNAEVNPAMQWAVERVIRSALLNVFWDRYDLPGAPIGSTNSLSQQEAKASLPSYADANSAPTEVFPGTNRVADTQADETSAWSQRARHSEPARDTSEHPVDDTGTKLIPEADVPFDDDAEAAAPIAPSDHGPGKGLEADKFSEDDLQELEPRRQEYDTKIKNALSLGGRVRWSTTALVLALLVVGVLAVFSSNPEGGNAGVLSPDKWRVTKTSEPAPSATKPSQSQTLEPTPTQEQTPTDSGDQTQAPDSELNQPNNSGQGTNPGTTANPNQPGNTPVPQRGNQPTTNPNGGTDTGSGATANNGAGTGNGTAQNPTNTAQ